jgi:linoleoyl-CoA desaturase
MTEYRERGGLRSYEFSEVWNRGNLRQGAPGVGAGRYSPDEALAAFWRDVAAASRNLLAGHGRQRHAPPRTWLKFALQFALAMLGLVGVLALDPDRWYLRFACYALAALPILALTAGAGHDACHGAISKHRLLNDGVLFAVCVLNGVDARLVRLRHMQHHLAPALAGADPEYEQVKILRLIEPRPWRPWHRGQHWYAWPLYALGVPFVVFVIDLRQILSGRIDGYGRFDRRASHLIAAAAIKLAHVGLWIAAPMALGAPVLVVLAGYLVFACSVSFAFTAVLVGTHLVDGVRLTARGDLTGQGAWVDRQLRSSVSISPGSRLARWFFGSIHTHAVHHLFPGVSHGRIDPLRRIVEEMAARHGIALIETTVVGVLAAHWRYLHAMGRRPPGVGNRACEPT